MIILLVQFQFVFSLKMDNLFPLYCIIVDAEHTRENRGKSYFSPDSSVLSLVWGIMYNTSHFLVKYFYLTPLLNTHFVKNEKKNISDFFPFLFLKWGKYFFWTHLTNTKFSVKFVDFIDYLQNRRCVCGALVRTNPIQVFF